MDLVEEEQRAGDNRSSGFSTWVDGGKGPAWDKSGRQDPRLQGMSGEDCGERVVLAPPFLVWMTGSETSEAGHERGAQGVVESCLADFEGFRGGPGGRQEATRT